MEPEFASEDFLFLLSGWWWIFLSSQRIAAFPHFQTRSVFRTLSEYPSRAEAYTSEHLNEQTYDYTQS